MCFILNLIFPAFLSFQSQATTVHLGSTSVQIRSSDGNPQKFTFLSLHENEQTAVTAARRVIDRHGGRLIELKAQGQRLVSFDLDRTRYTFDPNRIFTDTGLEKSLRRYGRYSRAAHEAVVQLRDALLKSIRNDLQLVVAIHNNTGGNLSVESYKRGGELQAEASRIAINPRLDPNDFFLVLNPALFARLQAAGFNVVLQSAKPTDDGSLSVYSQQAGIPYVNVEARYGHLSAQMKMLEALLEK